MKPCNTLKQCSIIFFSGEVFFFPTKQKFQAASFMSTCIKVKFPILDLLIFKQGVSCNMKLDRSVPGSFFSLSNVGCLVL